MVFIALVLFDGSTVLMMPVTAYVYSRLSRSSLFVLPMAWDFLLLFHKPSFALVNLSVHPYDHLSVEMTHRYGTTGTHSPRYSHVYGRSSSTSTVCTETIIWEEGEEESSSRSVYRIVASPFTVIAIPTSRSSVSSVYWGNYTLTLSPIHTI